MKKLIFLVAIIGIMATGCKKNDSKPAPTTFQIQNNVSQTNTGIESLDGTLWDVVVFSYDDNDDVVHQDNITSISYGGDISNKITAENNTTKVKVSFMLLSPDSPYSGSFINVREYTVSYFSLVPHQNNVVTIDGQTMMQTHMKSSKQQSTLSKTLLQLVK